MPTYPPQGIQALGAKIAQILPGSPFDDAGFTPGCVIHSVNGEPMRDVIDWRWNVGAEDEILLEYTDTDGDTGEILLEREAREQWGVEFEGLIFDCVKTCRNACSFCFMRQLPDGMRPALSVRDDDFRLSFLTGTFVTLTNVSPQDEERIITQNLSPLRFSLHAVDEDVRHRLIGRHAPRGLEAFRHLARAGIRFDVQVVLVPDENDGAILDETLNWAAAQPAIEALGIVPLGYTRYQDRFNSSFDNPDCSLEVLGKLEAANKLRGNSWAFAADEFYLNAYGVDAIEHIPPTTHYGDFAMFEDGVGMVRSFADDWEHAHACGLADCVANALRVRDTTVCYVYGEAMRPVLEALLPKSPLREKFEPLFVRNEYFGGNVTVTGLLTAQDIKASLLRNGPSGIVCLPRVLFNDDGVTLDDWTAAQLGESVGCAAHVVSCNPSQFLQELLEVLAM